MTVRNSNCKKVMFSQASVILSMGGGHAWQGECMAGVYMVWGMCGRGMRGREMRMAVETATAADGTHSTGMHSCCKENYQAYVKLQ